MIVVRYSIRQADGSLKTGALRVPPKTGDEGFDILERFIARFPPSADAPPVVPAGVRDTSRHAYAIHRVSGKLTRQQRLLVEFLSADRRRDYTRQELAQALGWGINVVCGRVNELLAEPFGALKELPRRACRVTSQEAHPVRLR